MLEKYALITAFLSLRSQKDEVSIRDLSRISKLSPSSAKCSLDWFYSHKMVNMRQVGRSHLFKLNNSFLTKHTKILASLAEISELGIISELISKNKSILSVILYGSVARGDDSSDSDIDLLIITRNSSVNPSINSEKGLKRELNITTYTIGEWRAKSKLDKAFYDRVIMDGIPLFGEKPAVI
jgi:predicted nucleotidyltransferase